MLAQRIAALAVSRYACTIRGVLASSAGRTVRGARAAAPQCRFQILGGIVAGTLAGFAMAAIVRRARLGCAAGRGRAAGRRSAVDREASEGPMPDAQPDAQRDTRVQQGPAGTPEFQASLAAPTTVSAVGPLPSARPDAGRDDEPPYEFEPETIEDLPEALRPPVTPERERGPLAADAGARERPRAPELAGVR